MLDNYVIEVLDIEHGQKVKKYFDSLGINTTNYKFTCNKRNGDSNRYYGLISGVFNNFYIDYVNLYRIKIIELPQENLKETPKEKVMQRVLKYTDAIRIIDIACPSWKERLANKWGADIILKKNINIEESFYQEMRNACTLEQNILFDEIFCEINLEIPSTFNNLKIFKEDGNNVTSLLSIRNCGIYKNKAFYLNALFNWEIKTDCFGLLCLVPTKNKFDK